MTDNRQSRRPPKANQFKPGQSGNPAGRPKGSKNFQTVIQQELSKTVSVTENGRTRKMTKLEMIIQRITHDSIKGNPKSTDLLFRLMAQGAETETTPAANATADLPDKTALRRIQRQLARMVDDPGEKS